MNNSPAPISPFQVAYTNEKARVLCLFPNEWALDYFVRHNGQEAYDHGFHYRRSVRLFHKEGTTVRMAVLEKGILQRLSGLYITHVFFMGLEKSPYEGYWQSLIRAPEDRVFDPPKGLYYVEEFHSRSTD